MKQILRQKIKELRKNFKRSEKLKADLSITEAILDLPQYLSAKKVLAYYPLNQEVDTLSILEEILNQKKQLFLPRVKGDVLEIVAVKSLEDLENGSFQVMEPNSSLKASSEGYFDLILVPGLAFSENKDRLGFGKAYYDRLLPQIQGYKIGLAYDFQILPELPVEKHDVRMDMVLSEYQVIL